MLKETALDVDATKPPAAGAADSAWLAPRADDERRGAPSRERVRTSRRGASLDDRLAALRLALYRADRHALGRRDAPDAAAPQAAFLRLVQAVEEAIGEGAKAPAADRARLVEALKVELLPLVSLAATTDTFYAKPRGYAGDFATIAQIYEDRPSGAGRIGPILDRCFLDTPPARAVRNRRTVMRDQILARLGEAEGDGRPAHVASLACGPAQEAFDVFAALDDPTALTFHGIDIDPEALAFVAARARALGLDAQVNLRQGNLLRMAAGRGRCDLPPQDLVYSIGLIDYFQDKSVVALIDMAWRLLRPGGRLVLGNFHVSNPHRAFMDHILEWKLLHRDEADMHRLARASRFAKPADQIVFESEGVNMFAVLVR